MVEVVFTCLLLGNSTFFMYYLLRNGSSLQVLRGSYASLLPEMSRSKSCRSARENPKVKKEGRGKSAVFLLNIELF